MRVHPADDPTDPQMTAGDQQNAQPHQKEHAMKEDDRKVRIRVTAQALGA